MVETNDPAPVTIITGASSGIGLELAKRLADEGHRLLLAARSPERLRGARDTLVARGVPADRLRTETADMGDAAQADALISRALDAFGRADALINNAGTAPLEPIDRHDAPLIRGCFAVNAVGPAIAIASLWRHWVRSGPAPHTRRVIVNVSSIAALDPFPGFFAYAASKAAVELLATSCASEGEALGVRAFAVAPGAVETPMLRALFSTSDLPERTTLAPADVAGLIAECVLGERDQDNGKTLCIVNEEGSTRVWAKHAA